MSEAAARFEAKRAWFQRYVRATLRELEPITAERVYVAEYVIMNAEVDAAVKVLRELGEPAFDPGEPYFARQVGTTCMSTSMANGMISLGEPYLTADPDQRVAHVTSDVVARTSAFGKPGEYRSVDDLFKYLEAGKLLELERDGERFSTDYAVRLTCSLLDVCECLWTGEGRLVLQRAAHAHLAYGLERDGDTFYVRFRDPMHRAGPGYTRQTLAQLRQDYLWSPLKKIPWLMGPHGFPELSADELLGHLERYDAMENLGVDCPSALLYRRADAPPLVSPPEEAEPEEETEPREADPTAEAR